MSQETPVITISGPQGSGKSRLLDTLAFDLQHRGFTVLEEHEGPIPAGEGMVVLRTQQATDEPDFAAQLNGMRDWLHGRMVTNGWYTDPATGDSLVGKRNVGELLMLIVSEIAEAMEGHRKGLADDKLPHRPMIEVEFADAIIRILDTCGALGLDVGGALVEKQAFNENRADHKLENRSAAGGKRY